MKKTAKLFLLGAGILLSLTGCEKGSHGGKAGNAVNLKIVTAETTTRSAYSGEGEWVDANDHDKGLKWERINWVKGDEILIWGTNVTVRNGGVHPDYGTTNIATYTVASVEKRNDRESLATLSDNNGCGLRYVDDAAGGYTLWGIYPATAAIDEEAPTGNEVSFNIPATQTNGENGPDMQKAVMLSVLSPASATGSNEMKFYPAFTAYQFDVTTATNDGFTLKRVKIASANGTTALCGDFTATIAAGGESTFTVTDGGSSITCTPSSALAISKTQHAVLTIFANPNGSEGLKVSFVLGQENSNVEIVRTATLKKSGSVMSFAGCHKHVIKGIIVPTDAYFDKITLRLQVQGWDEYTLAEAEASDNVQAGQFTVSGDGVRNGTGDYSQYWYFAPETDVYVAFKVMLPVGGTWSVVPVDEDGVFSVTNVSGETLSGEIGDDGSTVVKLKISYRGEDSDRHVLYLKTFATTEDGNTYSLDSETQLYDIRGYHYFVVNN